MEFINLGCQVCLTSYGRVGHLKNHMNSTHHRQKMADIFHKETFKSCAVGIRQNRRSRHNRNTGSRCYHHPWGPARGEGTTAPSKKPRFFPQIMMINPHARRDIKQPIVGLSLMTLCFSQDTETCFYLCHVCEEKCPPDRIAAHLSSIDHFRNYFSYANPNVLSFSWIPIMDKKVSLRPEVLREVKTLGPGKLQLLDLPEYLLKKLKPGTYSEAMRTLSENDKLLKLLEVVKPKRTMIQTYQRDSNRKHPLLGMQHLVECICVGSTTKRYYLCMLCHLTLATHMIIKHVLSFDHIYCYFKEWHPSTLLSKGSYRKYDYYFASTMLDFAKQAEEAELQRTANADMKQVSLEPAKFTSVNFASYAEALKELESIRKENKEGSLIAFVKPGNRLQPHTVSAAPVVPAGPTVAPAASSTPAGPTAAEAAPAAPAVARGTPATPAGPTAPAASVSPAAPALSSASSAPAGPTAVSAAPSASAAAATPGKPAAPAGPTAVPAASAAAAAAAAPGKPVAPAGPTTPAVSVSPAASSAPAGPTAVPAASAAAAPGKPVASAGPTDPAASTASVSSAGQAVPAGPKALLYKLHCQNCSMGFENINEYGKHLSSWTHKQMLQKHLDGGVDDYKTEGKLSLDLYGYHQESLKQNQPLIGVPLVVACVSSQGREDPVYVCFACEDCFPESSLKQHFDSIKHLINTLLHQNPWRLPFAWEKQLDVKVLRSMAWEEEKERGPKQMLLKVLDIPSWKFKKLNGLSYPNVMARLQQYHTILRRDVPPSERRSKLQQNERFPLLGANFVVMFNVTEDQHTDVGFLCLLCKRRLTGDECYGHVFSRDHVETFLSCFHPGSLKSSTDAETLLDLAKQATGFYLISDVQIIKLDRPIREPCSYGKAKRILETAKQKVGKIKLKPPITPKMKLVPRETWKKDKDHVSKAHCVEGGENAEKADNKETPTPSDKESKKRTEVILKTSSEEIQNAGRETCQAINEKKIEEPTARKPKDGSDGAEVGKETSQSTIDAQKQLIRKRKISQEDTCPAENETQEMDHKRQRLTSKDDTPCEEPQNLPSSTQNVSESVVVTASASVNQQPGAQLWQYLCRKSRDPVIGLNAILECNCDERDPIYLCECCSLKISEKDIISHVTGVYHQRMYLETERVSQKLSPPPRMQQGDSIKHLAALFEQENGYGEAQAVDLDDEIYNNILKQDFKSAIQTVKALQIQQDSGNELPSTSAPPDVQPEDTLVTLHPQHLVCSGTDDYQVVNMQIEDDPEDSKAQPSSVTTAAPATAEATSDTTRVPHESNKDDAMTHIKVSESADNVNTCMTVCRSSENKVKTISNTNVGPLKTATTSKTVTVTATLDSTVTTTSMTASSKFIAKSSNSTPDTTKSTAPSSQHTAATSSCTTANTKLRETAYKSTAATSICATTACKFTATSSSSCTTISSTATKSATVSKTLENRTGAAAKGPATSYKTATTPKSESTVVHEAACRTASKVEDASKNFENASTTSVASQTMVTSAKMSVKCENTEASVKTAHTKDSVGSPADVAPNARKSNPPAAPHLTARSENKNPNTQPLHTSASNTKPSQSLPRVGFNQLIAVTCKGRQQVYCQLCSVRLKRSSHTGNYFHVSNYLRMQYPGWNPKSHGHIVETATNHLAEVEKDKRFHAIQRLEVEFDEYRELAQLSEDEAVGRLKEMLIQRDLQCSSPSTADTAVALRQQFPSASPCEVSSPDDGMCMQQNKGLSTDNQSEQENRRELQTHLVQISEIESTSEKTETPAVDQSDRAQSMKSSEPEADDLISDQPHSFSILNKNEPVANPSAEDTGTAGARQKTEEPHLEEMVENLDEVKQRRVLSPLHETSVSSKADSVVSPILDAGKCPQDQPEPTVPILQHQRPMPELQVRQAEVHSESLSYSIISPQTSQVLSESPGDKCPPTRKRKADESFETLIRSCTNHPQLEDPFPAKRTCSVLQPVSQPSPESAAESTSINPAATSTLMPLKDGDAEQDTPVVDMTMIAELVALVRERKSEVHTSPHKLAPDNGDTETSCANNSSESGVERVWDPNSAQTTVAQKTTRWDLKWELVKVTNNPPPSSVSEEMFSTAAPVVLGHENQLVTPNASSVFSACSSSLEGSTSTRGDLLFRATEAKAFSTMLPSASTVDPTNPQQQRSDNAQSIFGHQSNPVPIHCTVTNDNPSQIPQPRDYTETDSTGVPQLPINTIVTSRPKPPKQQFMVNYNVQDNTEVNRGNQVTHSFSTGSPGDASGGYGQYSQMARVTTGQSGYFFSEAAASYPTPNNPPAYTWGSYQFEGQTTRGLHLSQMYPQQQANHFSVQSFGHSAAPPQVPEWVRLGMQQRALIFQEQYSSWPSASLSAGVGTVTNEAACVGAVPFMIPPSTSQMMDLSQYSTNGIAPTLNSNNMITQNTPQGELHPSVIYHLPSANTEVIFQPSANPYVATGTGFLP